eukprot:CAMPEP_0194069616 /NCGR_PEP_ID=MMETSP0009_2-20130614/87738_1 /TAXON_ID=210454 /ORGANISM="Grammatophora oceanica, Strain CCMP 410" /LENGTH=32 /DNA_ID= /DNA_START= /DNA_END= /DNA_ORIENTATION=
MILHELLLSLLVRLGGNDNGRTWIRRAGGGCC